MQLPIQIPTFEEIPIGQMVANVHDYKSYDRWIQNENEKQTAFAKATSGSETKMKKKEKHHFRYALQNPFSVLH